jgi:hypothetical protein
LPVFGLFHHGRSASYTTICTNKLLQSYQHQNRKNRALFAAAAAVDFKKKLSQPYLASKLLESDLRYSNSPKFLLP